MILAFVVAAFLIRLIYSHLRTVLSDWDSAVYLTLARNLLEGHGLREWPGGPPHTWFQPLYPYLISLLQPVTNDLERAGYLVSALFGSLLILPLYAFTRRLYTRRVALIAALLAVFNYRLVDASSQVITEMSYTFFWLWGLYCVLEILAGTSRPLLFHGLAGAMFGVAALIRTEGSLYFFALVPLLIGVALRDALQGRIRYSAAGQRLAAALLTYFLLSAPYLLYLHDALGYFTITGRSDHTVFALIEAQGDVYEFHDSSPFQFVLNNPGVALRKILHNLQVITREHLVWAFPPIFILLIGVSFFGRRWRPWRLWREAFLLFVFSLPWISFYGVTGIRNRYYFPFVALALPWVGKGIDNLYWWYRSSRFFRDRSRVRSRPSYSRYKVVTGTAVLVVFLGSLQQLAHPLRLGAFPVHAEERKDFQVGRWIREHSQGAAPGILCVSPRIAYYAGGKYFGESSKELDAGNFEPYLAEREIEYVVADSYFTRQWYPNLADLADPAKAYGFLRFVGRVDYRYDDGEPGYANIYYFSRSRS